jgi:hypothetical protein
MFHELVLQGEGATSSTPTLYLIAVSTSATKTTLNFSASVTGRLSDGDMISMSLSTLMVGGKTQELWTRTQAYDAQRLAGILEFPDNNTDPAGAPPQTHLLAQRISLVGGSSNQVTIPVGWPIDPGFSFVDNLGLWSKHNKLSTAEELKGTEVQSRLVVCWSADDQGQRLYAPAGQMNFVEPPAMQEAKVSLTTKQSGAVAPVVISFKTSSTGQHAAATGPTLLKLLFFGCWGWIQWPSWKADSEKSWGSHPCWGCCSARFLRFCHGVVKCWAAVCVWTIHI